MSWSPTHQYSTARRALAVLLIYVAVSVIALGANPFRGQTITPFDLLISQPAWSSVDPGVRVRDAERSDVLDVLLPLWINTREQWREGHIPVWDDVSNGGSEAFPLTEASLLTPSYLIFVATANPADGFYLAILLNLIIAGVGMHLFLRKHLGYVAAVVGAISFQLCGFHAAWLYWPQTQTSIWAPWLLLAVSRCADRPSFKSSIGIALASAMVILGGFPFVAMMVFGASGLYLLARCATRRRSGAGVLRLLGWYGAGVVLGFMLCALPLFSFVSWLGQYQLGHRGGGSPLTLHDWRLLFAPWAYRAPRVEFTLYVGVVITMLALLSPLFVLWRRARLSSLPIFGFALLLVSAGLVFGFWPMWLVGKFPGMSSNAWSRAICILDIALVVLGAWMLDCLWNLGQGELRKWTRVVVVFLAAVQVAETTFFFRVFNGPVSKEYFYPSTPAISYLRNHMGHFDYVVADSSFLVSGTLGAYRLREWFAHHFRGPALQMALQDMAANPFTTPTASRLAAQDIKRSSPAMATFNVRYVAVSAMADLSATGPNVPPRTARRALPPMPAHRYAQQFKVINAQRLTGISVRLATYRKTDIGGTINLTLNDNGGTQLATVTRPARSIIDNAMEDFYFPAPVELMPGTYVFALSFSDQGDTRPITAWAYVNRSAQQAPLAVDGHRVDGTIDYVLHIQNSDSPFREVFSGAGVTVLENSRSPDGPYFLSSVEQAPDARSGDEIEVTSYRADRFTLQYRGAPAGYIVVPMNMQRDWNVLVNGKPAETTLKEGVMPAVRVSGLAEIEFDYRPRVKQWLIPWMFAVALMLVLMVYADRRTRRSDGQL